MCACVSASSISHGAGLVVVVRRGEDVVKCLLAGRWAGKRRLTPYRWVEVRQENEGLSGAAYAGRYI